MIAIPIGLLSLAMAADTFWQIYFALESRTYDATVISVGEFNRRGSHVTYEKYQLQLAWTDEQGRKQTGETATDRSQLIRTGDTVRIQYAARSGLIRSAKNQSLIGPMLFLVSLLILAGLGVFIYRDDRARNAPIEGRPTQQKSKKPTSKRPLTRLRPINPDDER